MNTQIQKSAAIVGNDSFIRRIVRMLVSRIGGYSAAEFENARDICNKLNNENIAFDVLILDLGMPDKDVFEALHQLSDARHPGALILFSGQAGELLQQAMDIALKLGLRVLGSLPKPPKFDTLSHLLAASPMATEGALQHELPAMPMQPLEAIAANDISCLYQPIADARSGNLVGVDARLRWRHQERGAIEPDVLSAVAHSAGMQVLLAREVLQILTSQLASWQGKGLDVPVSLRVTHEVLAVPDFPDFAAACVRRLGVQTSSLIFRITESDVAASEVRVLAALARLRLRGFGLSLDNFGQGGISMLLLDAIHFDELRISPTVVCRAAAGNARVLHACSDVALRFGAHAIGGISNRREWSLCRHAGIDQVDGPFVSELLDGDALPVWPVRGDCRQWIERTSWCALTP
ncbi:oxygen sensor protein DosP [mine drainage metagenome]|uniref:Oxygen sensor protein DosP n=1 Tax=mine drainage metagenome TaxID=410659 RepID=A0A1J5R172_9ZZZZ